MRVKKQKTTICQLLLGSDLGTMAETLGQGGFEASKLILIGMNADGKVRIVCSGASQVEAAGIANLAALKLTTEAEDDAF